MKRLFFLLLIVSMSLLAFGQSPLRHTRFTLTVGTTDTMYVMSAFTGNQSTCMLSFNAHLSANDAVIHLGERPHPDSNIFNAYDNSDLPYTLADSTVSFKMARVEFQYMVIKLSPGSVAYGETIDVYMTTDRVIPYLPGYSSRMVGKAAAYGTREMIDLTGGSGGSSGAAGGGGALTGVASYSNATDDFGLITNAGTKTVTVTGAPYTVEYKHIAAGSGKVWNASTGGVSDLSTTQATVSAGVITFNGQNANFTSNDSVVLFLIMPTKTYDIAQDVNKTTVYNQDYAHYTDIEQIVDETNLDDDSVYVAIYMASYQYYNLHVNVSGGVIVTVYVTNNSAADDADETSDWVDYSTTLFGAANVEDAEGMYFQDTPIMPLKFLVKVVTTDASNAADIWLRKHY